MRLRLLAGAFAGAGKLILLAGVVGLIGLLGALGVVIVGELGSGQYAALEPLLKVTREVVEEPFET